MIRGSGNDSRRRAAERGDRLDRARLPFERVVEPGIPAEVAEPCLAHVPRSQVVQAYQRSDLLGRRAEVMQEWSNYLTKGPERASL